MDSVLCNTSADGGMRWEIYQEEGEEKKEEEEEEEVAAALERQRSTITRNAKQYGDELLELAGLRDGPMADGEGPKRRSEEEEEPQRQVETRPPWELFDDCGDNSGKDIRVPTDYQKEEETPPAKGISESDSEQHSSAEQQPSKKPAAARKTPSKRKKRMIQYKTSKRTIRPAEHESAESPPDDEVRTKRPRKKRVLPVWGALSLTYNPLLRKDPIFEVCSLLHMATELAYGERMVEPHPLSICRTILSMRANLKSGRNCGSPRLQVVSSILSANSARGFPRQ